MTEPSTIPLWATLADLESWPTRAVESPELGYRLPLPLSFHAQAERSHTPADDEDLYRGPSPGEWLSIRRMRTADPRGRLESWVASYMHLLGFPTLAPLPPASSPPRLVEWREEGSSAPLAARLHVDETRLFRGAAVFAFAGEPPSRSHLYILLARRGRDAWNICLALASACPPEAPEVMVARNDHARAGAIFGGLRLDGAAAAGAKTGSGER